MFQAFDVKAVEKVLRTAFQLQEDLPVRFHLMLAQLRQSELASSPHRIES